MAFDPSKATRYTSDQKPATFTLATPKGNPFAGTSTPVAGGLPAVVTPKAANDYRDPKNFATVPGPYDSMRATLKAQNPDIPASFIDDEIDNLNSGRTRQHDGASGANPNDVGGVNTIIQTEWRSEPDRTRYEQTDKQAIDAQKLGDVIEGATTANNKITANQQQAVGNFWNGTVTPAIQGAQGAVANQKAVDATQQGRVDAATKQYQDTLASDQAARVADTTSTNNYLTGLANDYGDFTNNTISSNNQFASQFLPTATTANNLNSGLVSNLWDATNSTNAANSALGQQITQAANSTNANQTGLYNTLAGEASSINDNQTQLFNELSAQAAASNAALSGANNTFQSQLGELNDQQMAADTLYQQQLSEMNGLDRSSLARYMGETDPLMAQMQAQGSDPADVARQQDVIQRYKDLSNPEVTDQERLVAELARRKFESDDQSNRAAIMQQLAGRGLRSGGLVIAGLQSANQQTAADRQLAEMNLNASAQQRAMQGLAGYADQSSVLRNADDAMRNFQDQYAQNDAVRRGNLSNQREAMNLAETNQETGRYTDSFNATTTSLNNNTQRDSLGFDANRATINDNYGRDESVFNAGTTTNNNNYARDQSVYNAGTQTNEDNFGRTNTAIGENYQINQGNLGNTQFATTTGIGVNNDNASRTRQALIDNIGNNQTNLQDYGTAIGLKGSTAAGNSQRTQGTIDKGDTAAKSTLDSTGAAATFATGNAASEAGTATGWAGQAGGLGSTFSTLSQSGADAQHKDVEDWLALHGYKQATDQASKAV